MTWVRRIEVAVFAAGVAAVVAFGSGAAVPAGAATAPSAVAKIAVGDNFFKPEDVTVTAGTKVTWVNKGKILHNVTPDKGKAYGKTLPTGKKYSYTFKKPGTYAYHCSFHGAPGSGQHGTIVVAAAPTPTTTSTVTSAP